MNYNSSTSFPHFRANPDKILHDLQNRIGYTLTNEQLQKAKLLALQSNLKRAPTLANMVATWQADSMLNTFALTIKSKLL